MTGATGPAGPPGTPATNYAYNLETFLGQYASTTCVGDGTPAVCSDPTCSNNMAAVAAAIGKAYCGLYTTNVCENAGLRMVSCSCVLEPVGYDYNNGYWASWAIFSTLGIIFQNQCCAL